MKNEHIDSDACRYCLDERQNCFRKKKTDRRCAFCAAKDRTNETCIVDKKKKSDKISERIAFFEKFSHDSNILSQFEKLRPFETSSNRTSKKRHFEKINKTVEKKNHSKKFVCSKTNSKKNFC